MPSRRRCCPARAPSSPPRCATGSRRRRLAAGPRPPCALHLGRRVRAPARAARRPRPAARRRLPRARRREPARRPRGSGPRRRRLLRQEHDADHAPARLVGRARHARHRRRARADAALRAGCGDCTICIDACPTGALDEPGTLDATKCLSYWTQAPEPVPEDYRAELGAAGLRVRHLPGRLPVEPRRREAPGRRRPLGGRPRRPRRLARGATDARSSTSTSGCTSPATTRAGCGGTRSIALGNTGGREHVPLLERYAEDDDPMLAEHASWALARVEERT